MRFLVIVSSLVLFSMSAFAGDFGLLKFEEVRGVQSIEVVMDGAQSSSEDVFFSINICDNETSCESFGPFSQEEIAKIMKVDLTQESQKTWEMGGSFIASALLGGVVTSKMLSPLGPRDLFARWVLVGALKIAGSAAAAGTAGAYIYSTTDRGKRVIKEVEMGKAVDRALQDLELSEIDVVKMTAEYFNAFKRKIMGAIIYHYDE